MNAKVVTKKKPATKPTKPVTTKPANGDTCPQGGKHAWTKDAGGKFCGKCKEPGAEKTKPAATPKLPQGLQHGTAPTSPQLEQPTPAVEPQRVAPPAGSKKLGCIDAAALVLATAKAPMTSRELITAMAVQNLWTSPAGQTPHATLYSGLLREIKAKGKDARFVKTERGKFAVAGTK
jgi:hypothetical protein